MPCLAGVVEMPADIWREGGGKGGRWRREDRWEEKAEWRRQGWCLGAWRRWRCRAWLDPSHCSNTIGGEGSGCHGSGSNFWRAVWMMAGGTP